MVFLADRQTVNNPQLRARSLLPKTVPMYFLVLMLTVSCMAISIQGYSIISHGQHAYAESRPSLLLTPTVTPADFSISANPSSITTLTQSTGNSVITLNSIQKFNGTVALTSSVSPSTGLTCILSPTSVTLNATTTPSGTSTLSCSGSLGTYTVTVIGTNGSRSHSATLPFIVQDFSLSASPTSVPVNVNAAGTSTITVTGLNGFEGTVSLTANNPACTLTPGSVSVSETSTLSCTFTTASRVTVVVTGISTGVSRTANVVFTVQDFTIAASPSAVMVLATKDGTSTITVSSLQSFNGVVSLTATTTSVNGLGCTLNPPNLTGSGSSTLSCNGSAGSYSVTVTGTSDNLSHNIIVTYTVQDFTIGASSPTQENVGRSSTSAITVSSLSGFTGTVTLASDNNLCSVNPNAVMLGSSSGSVLSCTSNNPGQLIVTVTGNANGISHTVSVTMTFGDYSLTANPPTVSLQSGSSSAATIVLTNNGYNGRVMLTAAAPPVMGLLVASPLPPVDLLTGQPQATTVLMISTTTSTPAGSYPILVQSDSVVVHSLTVTVQVVGNFTITPAKPQLTVIRGSAGNTTITFASSGFTHAVTAYVTPPITLGLQGAFNGTNFLSIQMVPGRTVTTILTMSTSVDLPPGRYNVTLTGQSDILSHVIYLNLTVSDFSLLLNPNPISIPPGQNGNTTLHVQGLFGFDGTVTLVATPLLLIQPTLSSTTVSLSSLIVSQNLTLTIQVQSSTLPGVYNVRVTGNIGRLMHTAILKLSVAEFSISVPPTIVLTIGQPTQSALVVISQNGFNGSIALSLGLPSDSGLTGQISPDSVGLLPNTTSSATLTLLASRPGRYSVNITGTSPIGGTGEVARSFQYVIVEIGDFTLSSGSSSVIVPLGTTKTLQIDLGSRFLFSGTIAVSIVINPPGLDVSNIGNVAVTPTRTGTATVTLSALHTTSGVFNVTIIGANGLLSHSISVRVTVVSPPSLSAPDSLNVNPGSLLTFHVTVTDSDQSVAISYTTLAPGKTSPSQGLPPGAIFYPSYRSDSIGTIVTGIFNWQPTSSQASGDYVITFTAQDHNGASASHQVVVHVNGPVSHSIPLPPALIIWYSMIAIIGIAATLAGSRIWRSRRTHGVSRREDSGESQDGRRSMGEL